MTIPINISNENLKRFCAQTSATNHLLDGMVHAQMRMEGDIEDQKKISEVHDKRLEELDTRLSAIEEDAVGQKRAGEELVSQHQKFAKNMGQRIARTQKKMNDYMKTGPVPEQSKPKPPNPPIVPTTHQNFTEHINPLIISKQQQIKEREYVHNFMTKRLHIQRRHTGAYGPLISSHTRYTTAYRVFANARGCLVRYYKSVDTLEAARRYRDDVLRVLGVTLVNEGQRYSLKVE